MPCYRADPHFFVWATELRSTVSQEQISVSNITQPTLSSALLSAFLSMCSRNSALFLGQRPWVQPHCLAYEEKKEFWFGSGTWPVRANNFLSHALLVRLLRIQVSFHVESKGVLRKSSQQSQSTVLPLTFSQIITNDSSSPYKSDCHLLFPLWRSIPKALIPHFPISILTWAHRPTPPL